MSELLAVKIRPVSSSSDETLFLPRTLKSLIAFVTFELGKQTGAHTYASTGKHITAVQQTTTSRTTIISKLDNSV